MSTSRPYALSIAGFDPSGGAGIVADIKTMNTFKVQGLSVITAITYQTEDAFLGLRWLDINEVFNQLTPVLNKYQINFVKIGIIKSAEYLLEIIREIKKIRPEIKIIWDPVLKSSSGYMFHEQIDREKILRILEQVYLITPNYSEIEVLIEQLQMKPVDMQEFCNILITGGHHPEKQGYDFLYSFKGKVQSFRPKQKVKYQKHGSGCIFSSAVCACLANGDSLHKAILKSKRYMERVLNSNPGLLAYHK